MKIKMIGKLTRNEYARAYYQKNKEKMKAATYKWRALHPNKWNEISLKAVNDYKSRNPDKVRKWGNEGSKRFKAKNKDKVYASSQAYRKKNIDKVRKWRRADYQRHREERLEKLRAKREANPGAQAIIQKRHYDKNPEKHTLNSLKARSERGNIDCYVSLKEWKSIMVIHNFKCYYCLVKLTSKNRSVDHKIPLIRGGTNDLSNLVASCRRCNSKKHSMTESEYREYITKK